MNKAHSRSGKFRKVAEHLYRYSANKTYYAVFKQGGKRIWKSLETSDRELANRRLKEELGKRGKLDHKSGKMTLEQLLIEYEELIKGLATHTQETRNSILKVFKQTWKHVGKPRSVPACVENTSTFRTKKSRSIVSRPTPAT